MNLKNKVAIVTASTKGIGLAISLKLAENGAKVYLAARNETLVNEIIKKYPNFDLNYVYFDALNQNSSKEMIHNVFNKENKIDILVNNFGTSDPKQDLTILDTDPNYFIETINKNLLSVFIPCKEAINFMKDNNNGVIINISSVGSLYPDISRIAYTTAKAAINNLSLNIALQASKYNIRCNAVLPGMINTPALMNNMNETFIEVFKKTIPLNKIGEPDDIANLVCFLSSDEAQYITGQIIEVSGGFGKSTPIYPLFKK